MSENGLHKIPIMKQALEAIQELHGPKSHVCECGDCHGPYCDHCQVDYPCPTRELADRALGAGNATNQA